MLAAGLCGSPSNIPPNANKAEKMLTPKPLRCFNLSFFLLSTEKRPPLCLQAPTHIFLIILPCQRFHRALAASLSSAKTHSSLWDVLNCYPSLSSLFSSRSVTFFSRVCASFGLQKRVEVSLRDRKIPITPQKESFICNFNGKVPLFVCLNNLNDL